MWRVFLQVVFQYRWKDLPYNSCVAVYLFANFPLLWRCSGQLRKIKQDGFFCSSRMLPASRFLFPLGILNNDARSAVASSAVQCPLRLLCSWSFFSSVLKKWSLLLIYIFLFWSRSFAFARQLLSLEYGFFTPFTMTSSVVCVVKCSLSDGVCLNYS